MSRRYASRRYAGGLGPSRIRTRIPTTCQLGQWVSLRKTLRVRVRLQLSQSRCLSLLLAMSGRVFLFLPPRGHEPPPTLRDRLNPNLSLCRHRFPIPRYAKCPDVVLCLGVGLQQQLQGSCARVRMIQNARRRNYLRMVRGGATIFRRSGWLVCVWS